MADKMIDDQCEKEIAQQKKAGLVQKDGPLATELAGEGCDKAAAE